MSINIFFCNSWLSIMFSLFPLIVLTTLLADISNNFNIIFTITKVTNTYNSSTALIGHKKFIMCLIRCEKVRT